MYFGIYCDHGGHAEQFLRFVGGCAPGKERWFRNVTLSPVFTTGVVFSLDESLELKHVMLKLAEFCPKHLEITIRYDVPHFVSGCLVEDAAVQSLFLSLLLHGKDLRPMMAIKDNSLLHLFEAADWYKDTKGAMTFPTSNLRFGWADKRRSVELFNNYTYLYP
jgi:hypothetical protein